MRITKFLHSCVLVEEGKARLLFDPGIFSFSEGPVDPKQFLGLDVICLTHPHPDHVDVRALQVIAAANPQAPILCNSATAEMIRKESELAVQVVENEEMTIGSWNIHAFPADHGPLIVPAPANTAYVINGRVLNPGDSVEARLGALPGIDVVLMPSIAPWAKQLELVAMAESLHPRHVIPIHDGICQEGFVARQYPNFIKYFAPKGIQFHPLLKPGDAVNLP